MVSKNFEVNDLVWAKMKGFPPWPGKIALPIDNVKPPKLQKPQHFVYFFGTRNYAWILDEHITPHSDEMMENTKTYKKRPATLQSAIEEIERESPPSRKPNEEDSKSNDSYMEGTEPSPFGPPSPEIPEKPNKGKLPTPTKKTPNRKRLLANILPDARRQKGAKEPRLELPPEFVSSTSQTLDLGDGSPPKVANVISPANNGCSSKVAVIPPYNEQAGSSACIIDRPHYPRPPTPPLHIGSASDILEQRQIRASRTRIGFLGLGMMGRGMVKNLLNAGHDVTLWNRTADKCAPFVEAGAREATTPSDVVAECDITFSCVADPAVAKMLVFGNCGVLCGLAGAKGRKGYVEMTSLDPVTSQEIAEAVSDKGGRYLEAPVIGSREVAEEGQLLILGAGDRDLFDDCESCFFAMSKMAFYLSCDVGSGARMNLVMSMLKGTTMAAMAEAVSLVETCKLSTENFLEILSMGPFGHPLWLDKGRAMLNNTYTIGTALKHQQKDLSLAIGIGNAVEQPLSLAAAANEVFKRAKLLSYSDHDVAAVHLGAKV